MAKVKNVERLIAQLRAYAAKAFKKPRDVIVGFTQNYAIYVHENLEAQHPVGQAKFLEQPARELQPVLRQEIRDNIRAGRTVEEALLLAGLHLQREAQKLCPVDTGALRASAFTAFEDEYQNASLEAKAKGDAARSNTETKRVAKRLSTEFREELGG